MSSIFIGLISGIFSSIFNILNRVVLKKEDDSTVYGWITESIRLLKCQLDGFLVVFAEKLNLNSFGEASCY